MLFFSPPMQFNLNAAGAGGSAFPVTYWMAQAYDAAGDNMYMEDVAIDSTGNIYLLSWGDVSTIGTASFDFILTKLNPIGEFQWTKVLGSPQQDGASNTTLGGNALSIDGDDNIIVAQTFDERGAGTEETGHIVKISSEGSLIWQQYHAPTSASARSRTYACIADKSTNDIYVCGETNADGASVGDFEAFVIKYNSSGTQQWANIFGTTGGVDRCTSIALDTSGDVLVSGYNTSGASRGLVAKLSKSTGAISWSRYVGNTSNNKNFYGMTAAGDDPVMTGFNQQNSSGSNDVWLVKYNNAGTYQWGRLLGGSGSDQGYAVAADDSGNIYVSGIQKSDLGHTSVASAAVLAKYNSSGTIQWQKHFTADNNSNATNNITALKFHPDGSLVLAIYSGNGLDIATPHPLPNTIVKLPADDTLWPSTFGQWSIGTTTMTEKAAASTEGSLGVNSNTSDLTSSTGALTLADPSSPLTEVKTDITI